MTRCPTDGAEQVITVSEKIKAALFCCWQLTLTWEQLCRQWGKVALTVQPNQTYFCVRKHLYLHMHYVDKAKFFLNCVDRFEFRTCCSAEGYDAAARGPCGATPPTTRPGLNYIRH